MPPSLDHRQRRIIQLSQAWAIDLPPAPQSLTRPTQPKSYRTPQDEIIAEDLLKRRQLVASANSSSPTLKRAFTTRRKGWDQKELFGALTEHVRSLGSAGVAEVLIGKLLAAGGDLNVAKAKTGLLSRRRSLENLGERSKLLSLAVENSQKEMVEVLAPHADTLALDSALPGPVRRGDAPIVEILLRYGGDISQSAAGQDAFRRICASGTNADLVSLILRSNGRPSPALASQCLVDAARVGCLETVLHLSRSIADGDFNEAEALRVAISQGRQDIALVIIMGNKPPRRPGLDEAFTALFARGYINPNEKLSTAELLLCAGAGGEAVDIALIHAAKSEFLEMVNLLVTYGASLEIQNAVVVRNAVAQGHPDLLKVLLSGEGGFSSVYASECVEMIPKNAAPEVRRSLLTQLLRKGAGGPALSDALIDAVEEGDIESTRLLLVPQFPGRTVSPSGAGMVYERHEVASVEHNGGLCLQIAVERGDVPMVKLLLGSRPNVEILGQIIPSTKSLNQTIRCSIIEALLAAGLSGPSLDTLLEEAINQVPRDDALLSLLLSQGPDLDLSSGTGVISAINQGDTSLLRALLQRASPQTAASAISAAMDKTGDLRRELMNLLLSAGGATGAEGLSAALVRVLQEQPVDVRLLRMFLEAGANANPQAGAAMDLAVNNPDPTIAELLLRYGKPSPDILRQGLASLAKLSSTQSKATKLKALLHWANLRPRSPLAAPTPSYPTSPSPAEHLTPKHLDDILPMEVSSALATPQQSLSLVPLKLLLSSGANVNANGGQSFYLAIRAANEPITDILFGAGPSPHTLMAAMRYAVHIKSPMDRLAFTKRLLDAGTMAQEVNRALVFAVEAYPDDVALVKTLAGKADVSDPEALLTAIGKERLGLVELLLEYAKHPTTAIDEALNRCMKLKNRAPRLDICRLLLDANPSNEAISAALLAAVGEGDFILGKLLVEAGATLPADGQAIVEASRSGSADMLAMVLASKTKPLNETLEKAFQAATDVSDLKKRAAVFEILLAHGVMGEVVDGQLVSAARYGDDGRDMLRILVTAGADPNYNDGESVCAAVRSAFLGNLEILLGRIDLGENRKSPKLGTLVKALKASWKLSWDIRYTAIEWLFEAGLTVTPEVHVALNKTVNEEGHDVKLAELLLARGASPLVNGCKTLVDAASNASLLFLPLLLDRDIPNKDLNWIFAEAFKGENVGTWYTETGFKAVDMLLRKGAKGDGISAALSTVLETSMSESQPLANRFVDLLVEHGADINYGNGLPLRLVTSSGQFVRARKFLQRNPTSETLSTAFLHVFDKDMEQDEALEVVRLFVDHPAGLDVHTTSGKPVLVRALERYPRSTEMLKTLLDAGYYHDQATTCRVLEEIDEEESVTLLTWAILQPQKRISSSVIEMLIARGAAVNFETKTSRVTPLMLAIQSKRQDVVKMLLLEGAEVDIADATGNTPLAMASALGGDLAISLMGNMLAAGAPRNDGSLHNAARELNLPAVQVLAQYGHDVDFPSHLHGGRSALGELCLHASDLGDLTAAREKTMEKVMNFLIEQGSDMTIKSDGKSVLLLALEAVDPVSTTRVLLKAGMWKQINKKFNLYSDGKHTYSPTMYARKMLKSDHSEQLFSLLKANRCDDVFYANQGPQPEDAVGLPEDLAIEERLRKARQERIATESEDHAISIARDRERAAVQAQIYTAQAELEDTRRRRLHQDDVAQRQQVALLEEDIFNAALRRKRGERIAELSHQASLTDATVNRTKAIGEAQLQLENKKAVAMLEWEEKMGTQRVDNERAMSAIRVSEREDVERLDRESDTRFRSRIAEQRRLVDSQTGLANRLQAGGMPRRQVGYIMGEAPDNN